MSVILSHIRLGVQSFAAFRGLMKFPQIRMPNFPVEMIFATELNIKTSPLTRLPFSQPGVVTLLSHFCMKNKIRDCAHVPLQITCLILTPIPAERSKQLETAIDVEAAVAAINDCS